MDTTVQAAVVVIFAYLINLGAKAIGLPIDPATVNSVAAVIVAYIVSKLFPQAVRSLLGK